MKNLKISPLTRQQLSNAMSKCKYIFLRMADGHGAAYNCKILRLKKLSDQLKQDPNKETVFYSYRELNFNEYINHKLTFNS